LRVHYNLDAVRDSVTRERLLRNWHLRMWAFHELLPVRDSERRVSLGEGGTFLHGCGRLSERLGIQSLYLKDETINPTGSFIDRGMAVEVSLIQTQGAAGVYCRTMGNIAVSMAAYAARAGLHSTLWMSTRQSTDVGKFYQVLAYGAEVRRPRRQASSFTSKDGRYSPITSTNPGFLEGLKTTAYEVVLQLQHGPPDWIVVPMGSGGHITQVWKALREMEVLDLLRGSPPRLVGVQSHRCAPIVDALRGGHDDVTPCEDSPSITRDIGMRNPRCGRLALQAIRESGGTALAVSDGQTIDAVRSLARLEGVFAEPSSATVIAAVESLLDDGTIDRKDCVVCIITGMGLKSPMITHDLVRGDNRLKAFLRRLEGRAMTGALGQTKRRILSLLGRAESYGYAIWKALEEEFGMRITVTSVYQHLSELDELGLVELSRTERTFQGRDRRVYRLTSRGRDVLNDT